jgi:hypothetical protein
MKWFGTDCFLEAEFPRLIVGKIRTSARLLIDAPLTEDHRQATSRWSKDAASNGRDK